MGNVIIVNVLTLKSELVLVKFIVRGRWHHGKPPSHPNSKLGIGRVMRQLEATV